jgi:hypothetical protein
MDTRLKEILINWKQCKDLNSDNTTLLLNNVPDASKICSLRMSLLEYSQIELYSLSLDILALENNYPKELIDHLEAAKDNSKICSCWGSSIRGEHPECDKKKKRYFDTEKVLLKWIKDNLPMYYGICHVCNEYVIWDYIPKYLISAKIKGIKVEVKVPVETCPKCKNWQSILPDHDPMEYLYAKRYEYGFLEY